MGFLDRKTLFGKLEELEISQVEIVNLQTLKDFKQAHSREKIEGETIGRVINNTTDYKEMIELQKIITNKNLEKRINIYEARLRVLELLKEEALTIEQLDSMEKDILMIGEDEEIETIMNDRINH